MCRMTVLSIPLVLTITGLLSGAAAAALDPDYLAARWEINAQGQCGGEKTEQLVLRANNTFEFSRNGTTGAVGFWRIEGEVLVLDTMTTPAFFQDIHPELKGLDEYEIYSVRMMPIDLQPDQFGAVASIGEQMQRLTLQRCP